VSFLDTFTNTWSTIGAIGKKLTGGGAYLNKDEEEKAQALYTKVQANLKGIDDAMSNAPGWGLAKNVVKVPSKAVGDLLLWGATQANEKVLSPLLFRPLSTLALLTDVNSPLYKKGEYEEGFQFSDVTAAYERSEEVSAFQALTKSDLVPGFKPLSRLILSSGDINLNEVNLWDNESIKENYVDNAIGRWFTGIGDLAISFPVFGVAGKGIGLVAKPLGAKAGLYTKMKTTDELAKDFENGIAYAKTNGVEGIQTRSGNHAVQLAESKDWDFITNLVGKYSTNDRLVHLVHSASESSVVKDLLLADKGSPEALRRLAATAPDKLFELSDTAGLLSKKFAKDGKVYVPKDAAIPRLQSVYETAIKSNPQFEKLRRAFFDDDYNINNASKNYMPMEPIIGKSAIIKAENLRGESKALSNYRDYDGFSEMKLGSPGRLGITLLKFSAIAGKKTGATTLKPGGFVTFSTLRPLDGRIELRAFMDSIKLFKDGNKSIHVNPDGFTKQKVSDVRREIEDAYMRSMENATEVIALKEIDAKIGRYIGYNNKVFDDKELNAHIATFRGNVDDALESFKQNGYGTDYKGDFYVTDIQTVSQLRESFRFTPWDKIEKQFNYAFASSKIKGVATIAAPEFFLQSLRELNRLWTFDVLARPMYITKQSFLEPLISAAMSEGIWFALSNVPKTYANSLRNASNWSGGKANNLLNSRALKKANTSVATQNQIYKKLSAIKDSAETSVKDLLSDSTSPATKAAHLKAAQNDLAVASAALDTAELNLRSMAGQVNAKADFSSATTLQRRIDFLKSNPSLNKKAQVQINKAEAALAKYDTVLNKLATNKKVIVDADAAVAKAYDDIDELLSGLKATLAKQADVYGKNDRFKKRYYGEEKQAVVFSNGEIATYDSLVAGETSLSAAIRAEIDTTRTSALTLLDEVRVGTINKALQRKVPMPTVAVTDSTYWAELAYQANVMYSKDALTKLILAESNINDLVKWSKTSSGSGYFKEMKIPLEKQLDFMENRIADTRRTFPSIEVRDHILKNGGISEVQLRKMLSEKADELYDIQTSSHAYSEANLSGGGFTPQPIATISNAVNGTMAWAFRNMAKAENPMRRAFLDNRAKGIQVRKANELLAQNVKMTQSQFNALSKSSLAEAIQDLEKTFYTIRRQNKLLFNARLLVAFPQATANAFTRYGRLAKKNPVGASLFASSYGRAFATFGVDENGNPTEDITEMTHLIFPGTKEMGLGYLGEGVALNAKSIGFLLNTASPSFISSRSLGMVMQGFPGTESSIKEMMQVGGVDFFEMFFPYGVSTSTTDQFVPPYGKALLAYFQVGKVGGMKFNGQSDWVSSYASVVNYHAMLVETGVQDKMPTESQITKEVKSLFREKFISGFMSLAGVPYKVETNPMRTTTNLYYRLQDQLRAEGKYSEQQVRDIAGDKMLQILGPKFMLDRVTFSPSTSNLNIPKTYEAYARVFEDNKELAAALAEISGDDINVLTLLTADLDRNPENRSDNITKILKEPDLTIPGTSKLVNNLKMTPKEAEDQRIKNRTWADYNIIRDQIESKIPEGKTLRSYPELKAILDGIIETTLKDQSQSWYDEYQIHASGDTSYKYARALETIVTDKKFMDKNGDNQFWSDAQMFVENRNMLVQAYQSLPDYDPRKGMLKDVYDVWIEQTMGQWDPNFKDVITRYFRNDTLKAVN
jgi:hypothetical protein